MYSTDVKLLLTRVRGISIGKDWRRDVVLHKLLEYDNSAQRRIHTIRVVPFVCAICASFECGLGS